MSELALPEGWVETEVSRLGDVVTGKTPKKSESENFFGDIPFVKPSDLNGRVYINNTEEQISEIGLSKVPALPENTIMVTCIGNLGKVGITTRKCATNQQINSVIPHELVNYKYLYYNALLWQQWLEEQSSATTISIVNKTKFSKAPVILTSVYEQEEIIRLLDTYLTIVSQIQARLDAIPKLIEKFRQSVLNDAVSGELIDYKSELNELDAIDLEEVIATSMNGLSKRNGDTGGEEIVLRLADFKNAKRTYGNERKIRLTSKELEKYRIGTGDILIIRVNGSVDLAGKFILYTEEKQPEAFCDHFIKIKLDLDKVRPEFVVLIANEGEGRYYLKNSLSTSAGQNTINQKSVKGLGLKLPPLEIQDRIIQKVNHFFFIADQIEKSVTIAKARVDNLTQSILHQAFTGNLTAEWREQSPDLISGENSAETLLAKIEAEKKANKTKNKK